MAPSRQQRRSARQARNPNGEASPASPTDEGRSTADRRSATAAGVRRHPLRWRLGCGGRTLSTRRCPQALATPTDHAGGEAPLAASRMPPPPGDGMSPATVPNAHPGRLGLPTFGLRPNGDQQRRTRPNNRTSPGDIVFLAYPFARCRELEGLNVTPWPLHPRLFVSVAPRGECRGAASPSAGGVGVSPTKDLFTSLGVGGGVKSALPRKEPK